MHVVVQHAVHVLRHASGAPLSATPPELEFAVPVVAIPNVVLFAALVVAGYALTCWVWPYTACGRCKGSGKARSPSGKAFRDCRRCKGAGRRIRLGRRLWGFGRDMRS